MVSAIGFVWTNSVRRMCRKWWAYFFRFETMIHKDISNRLMRRRVVTGRLWRRKIASVNEEALRWRFQPRRVNRNCHRSSPRIFNSWTDTLEVRQRKRPLLPHSQHSSILTESCMMKEATWYHRESLTDRNCEMYSFDTSCSNELPDNKSRTKPTRYASTGRSEW